MNHQHMHCKNCGQGLLLEQKFCHHCGQKTDTHRINFHFLVHELQHGIFHVDKGFLFTLKELFTRPGFTIKEYIEGKRKSHFPPVTLIMILGSIAALLNNYFYGDKIYAGLKVNNKDVDKIDVSKIKEKKVVHFIEIIKSSIEWVSHHFAIFMLLMIPFLGLGLYLAYKKHKKYNYAEFLVVATFIVAQALVINIITLPLNYTSLEGISSFLMLILGFITLVQLFREKNKLITTLRGFFALIIFVITAAIVCFVVVFLILYFNQALPL